MNNSAFSQQQRTQISDACERVQNAININTSLIDEQPSDEGQLPHHTQMTHREEITRTLRFYREREGWTTQDVADKIRISQSNYERIEAGAFAPNIDMLGKIARLYGCKVAIVPDTPQG